DGGKIQWLKSGKSLDDPWTMYRIGEEPTVHRMCFADLDGKGMSLIVAPLMGRNSTAKNNWMDGSPVRILAYRIPKDPTKDRWVPEVASESLHVVHNVFLTQIGHSLGIFGFGAQTLLAASYEGVTEIFRNPEGWTARRLGEGNQDNPKSNRGASEVTESQLKDGAWFIATVEPWHGHQVVVYTSPKDKSHTMWDRHVID